MIVIVVIGVISAITISSLIQNTQKQEYVSKLKKTYSTLSQVTNQIIAEEGSPKGDDSWLTNVDDLYGMYKKYLNDAKDCGSSSGCLTADKYLFLNGKEEASFNSSTTYRKLVLADGVQLLFAYRSYNCNNTEQGSYNVCGSIMVDINGHKGPNKRGLDNFAFVLKENGLYPRGCDNEDESECQDRTQKGRGCACRVLREGAINY